MTPLIASDDCLQLALLLGPSLIWQVARLEAHEESLAARLMSVEMSAEEQRRQYERRLLEATELLRSAQHDAARASEQEVSAHEAQVRLDLRAQIERRGATDDTADDSTDDTADDSTDDTPSSRR